MNLSMLLEIAAGGPGSGCKGPNCGRHPGMRYTLVPPVPGKSDIHKPASTRYTVSKYARRAATSETPLEPSTKPGVAQYHKNIGTNLKTTGTKWMTLPHTFKGYFHQASQVTSIPQNAQITTLKGPGRENGGTIVTVTHNMQVLDAPLDRLHVKEQDVDEFGSIFRTRSRTFVQVKAGKEQIKNRYGVTL